MADIHTLARAVLDTYENEDSDLGRDPYTVCAHCSALTTWDVPMLPGDHALNCPVLIALKVLNA